MAPYECVWVNLAEGPKMQDTLQIKDFGNYDRKTGELWLEDTGFTRFTSCFQPFVCEGNGTARPLRATLAGELAVFALRVIHTTSS